MLKRVCAAEQDLVFRTLNLDPRTYKEVGRGGRGVVRVRVKVFLIFFLGDKTSALEVFCSCSFILRAHFETSLLMVSYYGYEI